MILIANDLYGLSPELRARCDPVQFKAVPARSIAPRLKYLCAAEKIQCSEAAIHAIAESSEGDIRSAVNMLYASAIGRTDLTDAQVHTSQKDERVSIFSLITALFGRATDEELLRLSYDVDDTPETIEQWVEGNAHFIAGEPAIGQAYRSLSRADEYLGYTYRRQYHTLWRYATAIMLLGFADAAGGKGIHARIMPPERWQKMSTAKKQKAIRTVTLNKIAGMIHVPQNTLRENYLGTLSVLVTSDPMTYAKGLPLDADQLNFFLNDKARSAEIIKTIAKEEKELEKEKEPPKKAKKEKVKPVEKAPEKPLETHLEAHLEPVVPAPPAPAPDKKQETLPEAPAPVPEAPAEKKPAKTQSTLFDGF
jgi:replication factor C large subunit